MIEGKINDLHLFNHILSMSLHIDIWQNHNKLYDNKYKDKCDSISGGDNHRNPLAFLSLYNCGTI